MDSGADISFNADLILEEVAIYSRLSAQARYLNIILGLKLRTSLRFFLYLFGCKFR